MNSNNYQELNGYELFLNQKINDSDSVIKCAKPDCNKQLCVKIINKHNQKGECGINQYIKELKQKYLVEVMDIFSNEENHYIVMEYCHDGNLRNLMTQKTEPFNAKEILRFVYQFIQGYQDIFQNDFLHRNIKPENILIDNQIFKIGDFGVNWYDLFNDQIGDQTTTGTPDYQAPELFEPLVFTPKCDMYSLGLILYEMAFQSFPNIQKYSNQEQSRQYLKFGQKSFTIKTSELMPLSEDQIGEKEEVKYLIEHLIVYDENQRLGFDELYDRILFCTIYRQFKKQYQVYQSLADQLASLKQFTYREILTFIYQIVKEYNILSKNNKIHGKINPQRIIIQNGDYKLIGLGKDVEYSKFQYADNIVSEIQKNYWSPFMLKQTKQIKFVKKCDVYALGIIIYQMASSPNPIHYLCKNPEQFTKAFIQTGTSPVDVNNMKIKATEEEKSELKKIIELLIKNEEIKRISFFSLFGFVTQPRLSSFIPIIILNNIQKFLRNQQQKLKQFNQECEGTLLSGIIVGYKYNLLLNMIAIYRGRCDQISEHLLLNYNEEAIDELKNNLRVNDFENIVFLSKELQTTYYAYVTSLNLVKSIEPSTEYQLIFQQYNNLVEQKLFVHGNVNEKYKEFSTLAEQFFQQYMIINKQQLAKNDVSFQTLIGNGLIFASLENKQPQSSLREYEELPVLEFSESNAQHAIIDYLFRIPINA